MHVRSNTFKFSIYHQLCNNHRHYTGTHDNGILLDFKLNLAKKKIHCQIPFGNPLIFWDLRASIILILPTKNCFVFFTNHHFDGNNYKTILFIMFKKCIAILRCDCQFSVMEFSNKIVFMSRIVRFFFWVDIISFNHTISKYIVVKQFYSLCAKLEY